MTRPVEARGSAREQNKALCAISCSSALGLVLCIPCFFSPLFDDAYIHARIAEQLLASGSAGFNPGTALKTDSATGYLLMLSAVTWWTGDAVSALRAIQSVSVLAYVMGLYRLSVALNGRLTRVHGALLLLALPPVLWAAYGGMETSTAAACLVLCATASLRARHGTALFWASLAACLRIELSLFVLYYAVWWLASESKHAGPRASKTKTRRAARAVLACGPLFGCLLFDLLRYHSILPQAAVAKSVVYDLPFAEGARLALSVSFERYALPLTLLQATHFTLWGLWRVRTRAASPLIDGLTLQAVVLLGLWAVSRSIMFPWYVASFSVCISILALSVTRAQQEPRASRSFQARLLVVCTLQAALGCLSVLSTRIDLGWVPDQPASGVRAQRYLALGAALYAYCPKCTTASSEIGGLGYGFRGRIYDAVGLADPTALAFHPLRVPDQRASYRVGAIPPAYIALRAPDFVVSMPIFSEAFRRSPEVRAFAVYDCALVPAQPTLKLWGDAIIQIFSRHDLPEAVLKRMQCSPASAEAPVAG